MRKVLQGIVRLTNILEMFVRFHIDVFNKIDTKFIRTRLSPLRESVILAVHPFKGCKNITETFRCVADSNKIYRFRKGTNMWQYVILYCNNLIIYMWQSATRAFYAGGDLLCGVRLCTFHLFRRNYSDDNENNRCVKEKHTERYIVAQLACVIVWNGRCYCI